ncbi:MAG: primosomal protein N' [Candidatus Omnitrophica bacterium]|nr:primosomal protein N' [Candidatus Omnitrophota bacterium]
MLYAKIVVGLPVSGTFDYLVPETMVRTIKPGARVWINFGTRRIVGYVVALAKKSQVKDLKPVLELIDKHPLLDKKILLLTGKIADYYCCSWGEAIETALPETLRKGKKGEGSIFPEPNIKKIEPSPFLIEVIHDLDGRLRWDSYLLEIKNALENKLSVVVLLPDIPDALKARDLLNQQLGIAAQLLYRKQPNELEEWLKIKSTEPKVIVGTRSAVFAPLANLGLLVIDEEENSVYKQDQVPHYHARQAAIIRSKSEGFKLILGSRAPSLESFYLGRSKGSRYTLVPRKKEYPEVKIIDTRHLSFAESRNKAILSKLLEDALYSVLNEKGKALLFLNRRGFATSAACHNCGKVLKCPRCNLSLVYHYKEDTLSCHYCNFKMQPPKICPQCNAGYIKFSGAGTEKIESELSRIFPQARIKILDDQDLSVENTDIAIATSGVIKRVELDFDLIGVLGIDNTLNRVDFRAAEKTFGLLAGLMALTHKRFLVQTSFPAHHCFQALLKKDVNFFYTEELKQRKQLAFPPYRHLAAVKLRGKKEEKVKETAGLLFSKLKEAGRSKTVEVISVNPSHPPKLRGNFYWQVLLGSKNALAISLFLKNTLKDFRHSGIIVTIDVDPV